MYAVECKKKVMWKKYEHKMTLKNVDVIDDGVLNDVKIVDVNDEMKVWSDGKEQQAHRNGDRGPQPCPGLTT